MFMTDTDECFEEIDNCCDNSICKNNEGSFECECKSGFKGDGVEICEGTS